MLISWLHCTALALPSAPHSRLGVRGQDSIENGTLLCAYHHREFAQLGWACMVIGGSPQWVPPKWWDPDQKPLVNTAHDPPG